MKLNLDISPNGAVTGIVTSWVEAAPVPTPTPTPTPTTPPIPDTWGGGTIDDQVGRLLQWQFDNPAYPNAITIDGNPYGQPGQPPAVQYSTAGGILHRETAMTRAAIVAGLTGTQITAVQAAPMLSSVDPTKLWETTPSTLDPASMSFLLAWQGGNIGGMGALEAAKKYRVWYYKRYGRQAPPPAPRNTEVLTDAELAQIIAS